LVSTLYASKENKPGYGQLYIFDIAEATAEQLENQSNQGYTPKAM
jgi:hypothetical protein